QRWSAGEVAARWVDAVSPDTIVLDVEQRRHAIHALCSSPERIDHVRQRLGSLSAFMQQLKQPIARQANLEDGVSGHFFDQRFYSGALLSEQALLAAMAYVDLNPVRARIAKDIDQCRHTSIARRLEENSPHRLENALAPLVSGIETRNDDAPVTSMTLKEYLDVLRALIALEQPPAQAAPIGPPHRLLRWAQNVAALRKRQRVFCNVEQLSRWLTSRNMLRVEKSLA
ncbi:MAG: hypothetical protein K0U93_16450, partial [Gammaproteobacteria bacterium]|nr:hypothetical protein [Gammaproteobacteria bacterium]